MNCQEFADALSWRCTPIQTNYAAEAFRLVPPVRMWDGTLLPLYVFSHGDQVELTDDGAMLYHLDVAGFDVGTDQRKWRGLERMFGQWGVTLSDDGAMQLLCRTAGVKGALLRYQGALFALARWQHEHAGRPMGADQLIVEVETFLRVIYPDAAFHRMVEHRGISGRPIVFPLQVDATLIDSLVPHPVATSSLVSKIVDFRSVAENAGAELTVVVDDRVDSERLRGDIQVLTQVANPLRLSELEDQARQRMPQH